MTIYSRNLFVSDLDDTLIFRGALTQNSRAELSSIIEAGILFTIASARGFRAALSPFQDVRLNLPVIVHNGSVLINVDGSNPRIIGFPSNLLNEIEIVVSNFGEPICKLYTNGIEDSVVLPENSNMFTRWSVDEAVYFKEHSIFRGSKAIRTDANSLIRLVVCTSVLRAKEVASVLQVFETWVSCLITESRDLPGYAWLEISPVVATKGHAVSLLASEIGIPIKNVVLLWGRRERSGCNAACW